MNIKKNLHTKSFKIITLFFILFFLILFFYPLKLNTIPESTIIYDINNTEIGEIVANDKYKHREIFFDEIPDFYKKILINFEDRSFYYNLGISPSGIIRSFWNNYFLNNSTQGASTISAQFIRNNLWLNEKRNFSKKILEFILAFKLNLNYSKNEILTKFSNQIYFGYLNYGLKSASLYYFGKEINSLTQAEILVLFTIQKNSSIYDPYKNHLVFRKRFELLTKKLFEDKIISKNELDSILSEKLIFNINHKNQLPYIVDYLKKDFYTKIKNNNKVQTTIDYNLTQKIEEIGDNIINELSWKNVGDYGVIIADKKTKELKVMIGGKNYYSPEGQVNSTLALRQPGSTIKPFTYLLATKNLGINPDDTILDLPVLYKTKDSYSYEPQNYSTQFSGEVSYGEALAQSINVPAVKILEKLGVKTLQDFLKNVGISSLSESPDFYGLALTLGDGEVSLFELTRAYSIFAYDGFFCNFQIISSQNNDCTKIIDKKFTDKINYILSSRFLKLGAYPVNSSLDFTDYNVFFKTGTSRNFRDNWTMGYTDNYIIGVWAGNKDASNMKGVSGATGAGEIFGRIVKFLENRSIKTPVFSKSPVLNEKYLEITNPLDGQVYLLDKNNPKNIQKTKLEFATNYKYTDIEFTLNGQKIDGDFLQLKIGKQELLLKLFDNGKIVKTEKINFEVVDE